MYLDVRAPHSARDNLPVMFWIHGGGNTSGHKDFYDFSELVKRKDVIVVSINYRLGPLGFFTHPAIQDSNSGLDKTSNFGILDIILALKWVSKNIDAFGGSKQYYDFLGICWRAQCFIPFSYSASQRTLPQSDITIRLYQVFFIKKCLQIKAL